MLLLLVVWPVVAIALELVIALLILLVAVAGRVVFRRPWTVYAMTKGEDVRRELEWQVVGWRASGRLVERIGASLERGDALPEGAAAADQPAITA